MATSANLPSGAFITTLGGRRCTAIPRANSASAVVTSATSTAQSTISTSSSFSSSSSSSSSSSTSTSSAVASSSTSIVTSISSLTSTSTTAEATTTQAAVLPPPAAPVVTGTTTTTAAPQETLVSTTSPTSIAQFSTQTPPETVQTSSTVVVAPVASPDISTTSVVSSIVSTTLAATSQTQPESELQSQTTQTNSNPASTTSQFASVTAGNAALLTTIGTAKNGNVGQAETTSTSAASTSTSIASTENGVSTQTTVAVVGGVIGGVVAVSLIAFLVWFWRKRIRQKRRSTLLTPLGPEPGFGNISEKMPYTFSRDSIGPTAVTQKLKALVGSNVKKIRGRLNGHSSSSSVNLNRGNSQYFEGSTHSRDNSADFGGSAKDRLLGFFGRFGDKPQGDRANDSSGARGMQQNKARSGSQPDFLTLLSMDDKQLAAQANKGGNTMSNPRRSQSAGSNGHFLGSLNLNFDAANPFSDANAMTRESAKVAPLAIMNPDNPFSDANAVQQPSATKQNGPATYVQNIRRSRGTSIGGVTTRPPSTSGQSVWRESGASVESFATRRNKFRSDPFDLDRPELLSSSFGSQIPTMPTRDSSVPKPPYPAHTRKESSTSSKYSSGVSSIDQWSDPGPDVGPAISRYDSAKSNAKDSGVRKSGASQATQGSVGKAY